ncbi:Expansin-A2 [Vitis vinifera]|uniref:Expansin n=1 Tax=Vitis vinifera TaxID=29760 RepID=A0A438CG98_VITVI|nr:Expansin-A2 [Vitis vinifera]
MALPLRALLSSLLPLLLLLLSHDVHANGWTGNARHALLSKHHRPKFKPGPWHNAHATFYGGADASQTMGGACGYGDLHKQGYGVQTAALSTVLFNVGRHVGLVSKSNVWMIHRGASEGRHHSWLQPPTCALQVAMEDGVIHLVNTLISPSLHFFRLPSTRLALFRSVSQVTCSLTHFFLIVTRMVPCKKKGGIRFTISGNPYFNLVFIWNVGGAGDITSVQVKGDRKLKWTTLKRNWGQNWETDAMLVGESLTFRVREVMVDTLPPGISPQRTGSSARPLKARTSSRDLSI